MKEIFYSSSPEETCKIAYGLAEKAKECKTVCLVGTMGAGKTAFTSGLVEALAPECLSLVHSPTFAIVNEYIGKNCSVFHFDLYRIKSEDDLYSTGFYDYEERGGVIVAEWSDMFADCFPADAMKVEIIKDGEESDKRTICVEYGG